MENCRWIAGKISEILGNEDDVVVELCFNLLERTRFVRPPVYLF
jgi:serine/arginine repetitive matrix protein 1